MTQIPEGRTEADKALVAAKKQLESLIIQFHKVIGDRVLPENKTQGQLKAESDFVLRLLSASKDLDDLNPPEGTFVLITLLIREGLLMRDNYNKMEHRLETFTKEIEQFRRQMTDLGSRVL